MNEEYRESLTATKWAENVSQKDFRFAIASLWRKARDCKKEGDKKLKDALKSCGPNKAYLLKQATEFHDICYDIVLAINSIAEYSNQKIKKKYANFDMKR